MRIVSREVDQPSDDNTLLTDLNVSKVATVRGALNFVRCVLLGASIAALEPMVQAVGLGRCFGIFAALQVDSIPAIWPLSAHGIRWKEEKAVSGAVDNS